MYILNTKQLNCSKPSDRRIPLGTPCTMHFSFNIIRT